MPKQTVCIRCGREKENIDEEEYQKRWIFYTGTCDPDFKNKLLCEACYRVLVESNCLRPLKEHDPLYGGRLP
jgi:hypothetical protein